MFFGAGDVYVNLNCKTVYDGSADYFGVVSNKYGGLMKIMHTLEVAALDTEINVTAEAVPQAPREIVISCLLAGVKKVADSWIYDGACAKIESQLGFAVDRWISPDISSVTMNGFSTSGASFEVEIEPVIFSELVAEPKITAFHIVESMQIDLEMVIQRAGQTIKSRVSFSDELFNLEQAQCMDIAKHKFVESLYKEMPELSHLWTQIRYNWFGMGQMSPEAISWMDKIHGKNTDWKSEKANGWKNIGYVAGADRRVEQLPALNEMVKNPVNGNTAPLSSVIINLNDTQRWTREQIADWLDTLDIDISFKVNQDE